jgi:hypothetical protein
MPPVVYSIKVERDYLYAAKDFFLRAQISLQDALRAQVKMAADCEKCLSLAESKAPVEQIQSAFASILADAKETFHLNGLFRDAILKGAESSKLPVNFIENVMAEAERIQNGRTETQEKDKNQASNHPFGGKKV